MIKRIFISCLVLSLMQAAKAEAHEVTIGVGNIEGLYKSSIQIFPNSPLLITGGFSYYLGLRLRQTGETFIGFVPLMTYIRPEMTVYSPTNWFRIDGGLRASISIPNSVPIPRNLPGEDNIIYTIGPNIKFLFSIPLNEKKLSLTSAINAFLEATYNGKVFWFEPGFSWMFLGLSW